MTTTRIHFEATGDPDNPTTLIQINAPGLELPPVMRPVLDLDPHQAVLEPFLNGLAGANDIVAAVGDTLWQCLAQHQNANAGFHPSLAPGAPDRKVTVSFEFNPREAKALPWEALRVGGKFLCYDNRVPIVREVASTVSDLPLVLASDEKLRFLAVIGARGDDGVGEWDALAEALKSVAGTLPLDVLLLSSNQALLDTAMQINEFSVTAQAIPTDPEELVHDIERFVPHIAHFFCHGHADGFLEIEPSGNQWAANPAIVKLEAVDLEKALLHSACVTVLNACSLAGQAEADGEAGSLSLCEDLVQSGFPMVIGMRAPVNAADAGRFARNFHRNALRAIQKLLDADGGPLDLARDFGDACRAIPAKNGPGSEKREPAWTLPVMNLRPAPPTLTRIEVANHGNDQEAQAARAEKQAELDALLAVLKNPPAELVAHVSAIAVRISELQQELAA